MFDINEELEIFFMVVCLVIGMVISVKDGFFLIGVIVVVKGMGIGIVIDIDGNFFIDVEGNDVVLVIIYIGFKVLEV